VNLAEDQTPYPKREIHMNTKRIALGGLVAGLVVVIGEAIRNSIFTEATPTGGGSMPLGVFILRGLTLGILCMLLYAAVRPRLGAGVKTAVTVGILIFLVGTLFPPFGLTMQAFASAQVLLGTIVWNAIQLPAATVAGAWLYREGASEHDAAQLVLGGPLHPLR
jgi:hypothetical protein